MAQYRIPLQEEVRVWQDIEVIIDTEDDIDTIYQHIVAGDFISTYSFEDCTTVDTFWDTEETLDYSYENTSKDDIEEV